MRRVVAIWATTLDRLRFLVRTAIVDRQLVTVQRQAPCLGTAEDEGE